jgi:hypothetical protein
MSTDQMSTAGETYGPEFYAGHVATIVYELNPHLRVQRRREDLERRRGQRHERMDPQQRAHRPTRQERRRAARLARRLRGRRPVGAGPDVRRRGRGVGQLPLPRRRRAKGELPGPCDPYYLEPYAYADPGFMPDAAEMRQLVGCYAYQACEHPGWSSSVANGICEAIMAKLGDGPRAGAWGWDERHVARRIAQGHPDIERGSDAGAHAPRADRSDLSADMTRTGEYVAIDLDENNAHTRREWAERHPGETSRSFGWGVCRHGHGLQDHGQDRGVVYGPAAPARAVHRGRREDLERRHREDNVMRWAIRRTLGLLADDGDSRSCRHEHLLRLRDERQAVAAGRAARLKREPAAGAESAS